MATHARSHGDDAGGPELALAGASALTAGAWKLPFELILPVTSLVLLASGFALALAAWTRPVRANRLSYRDVAGLLVFFGFGAALMSDSAALSPLFAGDSR
jgi:hypothetical protein